MVQYERMLKAAVELMQVHHEMKMYHDAMIQLGSSGNDLYKPSPTESTNFDEILKDTILVLKEEEGRYIPEKDPQMQAFHRAVQSIMPETNEVIDDDIQIEGNVEKNTRCPLTMKLVRDYPFYICLVLSE